MDQGSDYIRQDIESTRAALDEKLDTLETKARQTFDLKHQIEEHPWAMLGGAFAAGFVVGNLGADDDNRQPERSFTTASYETSDPSRGDSFLSQFDDEIKMLKTAAVSTLISFLRDSIRTYAPAMSEQLERVAQERGKTAGSTAPPPTARPTASPYGSFSESSAYGASSPASEQARAVGTEPNR